jgi:tetratricopeptide (TPR) repeat protein
MGLFQRKSGLKEEARASLERAITLNPKSVISYCSRAYIYLDEGNSEKAMEEAKKAEEIIYKSDRVYYIIGLIEEEMKHIEEAITYYKKTIDYNHLHRDAKKRLINLESRGNYGTCS